MSCGDGRRRATHSAGRRHPAVIRGRAEVIGSASGRGVGRLDMSAWSPLQYRVYRTLWIALLASNIGTWMQAVGAAWLMVELDASPAIVALVQTATYLPVVVVGVLAGAAADLVERRRLLLITQGFMLAAAGALAVLVRAGRRHARAAPRA